MKKEVGRMPCMVLGQACDGWRSAYILKLCNEQLVEEVLVDTVEPRAVDTHGGAAGNGPGGWDRTRERWCGVVAEVEPCAVVLLSVEGEGERRAVLVETVAERERRERLPFGRGAVHRNGF